MKKQPVLRSVLCLLLLLAVLAAGVYGINGFTAPRIAENERLAAEAAAAAEKALLGNSVMLFDREDEAASTISVSADTVQSVYQDDERGLYLVRLSTSEGYSKLPILLTLTLDYDGKIVSLDINENPDDKELGEEFPLSFEGQDSTLAGVNLVAGVTFSSSAIRNAVNDGFNALIDNGLFAAAEKSDDQLLNELLPQVYPGLVNKAGVPQGEELAGSGSVSSGIKAANGSGLIEEIQALSDANADDYTDKDLKAFGRMLDEDAELTAVEIPGLCNSVNGAYIAQTADGERYAFVARPYGYSNEVMDFYYVLDEDGAIDAFRIAELILYSEYYSAYTLDEDSYKEGLLGLTQDSYTGEQTLISGATMTSQAADTAMQDVFEAYRLLMESRG